MSDFKYKCTVLKNGSKRYYKNTGGKWYQITNKLGKNAEKGKRKYMAKPIRSTLNVVKNIKNYKPVKHIGKQGRANPNEIFDFKREKYYKSKDFKQKCNKIGFNKNNFEKVYSKKNNNVYILAYMNNGPIIGWEDGRNKQATFLKEMMENNKLTTNTEKKIMQLVASNDKEIKKLYINFVNMNEFFSNAIAKAQEILDVCHENYKNQYIYNQKHNLFNEDVIKQLNDLNIDDKDDNDPQLIQKNTSELVIQIKKYVNEILKLLQDCNFKQIDEYYFYNINKINEDNKKLKTNITTLKQINNIY